MSDIAPLVLGDADAPFWTAWHDGERFMLHRCGICGRHEWPATCCTDHGLSAKAAIIGLTKSAASEVGRDNIRVNAIAPGGTATEGFAEIMGGDLSGAEQRAKATQLIAAQIQPEDLTGTLLHLVSDGAKFITGQTIVVDGGKYFLG